MKDTEDYAIGFCYHSLLSQEYNKLKIQIK